MHAPATHTERVLQLLRKYGWLRAADLAGAGIPRVVLTRMTASGQLERAARGLYRLLEASPSELAMPRGSHVPRLDHPPIKMVQFTGEACSHGIEVHERDGVELQVYGVAKTVADCFKHRNKIGLDVALEALKDALSPDRKGARVSFDDLWRCAKVCRVANVMRPYMDAMASVGTAQLQCGHVC